MLEIGGVSIWCASDSTDRCGLVRKILSSDRMIKMSPIKDFHLVYNVLNSEETFSEGDTVGGTVSFTLTKETKVKSIVVKLKGQASVSWSEGMGDDRRRYSDHRKYFKVKQYLVTPAQGGRWTLGFVFNLCMVFMEFVLFSNENRVGGA